MSRPGQPGESALTLAIRRTRDSRDGRADGQADGQAPQVVPSAHNPDVERDPPPPLTPLDFPIHSPSTPASAFDSRPCENLPKILLSIKKPSDITSAHVDSFKIKLTRDVEFSAIIPSNGQSYLPPLKWWEGDLDSDDGCAVSDSTPPNRPKLNNGNTAPRESQYESIKKELLFSNTDCYRVLQRLPEKEGRPNVRLTDTRKFYLGLHQMSEYWDSSLDQFTTEMGTDDSPPKSKYKGLRSSTGREMPEQYRDATVRAFVEMVAWPFKCQIITPTVLPRLAVQSMYFPVRYSLQVNRSPLDRALGRSGHQEGPIMAIQCRPETKFREEGDAPGHGNAEMVDLLREVAVMLLLAQERAREGTTETRQGEGKWWTTVPRWGGGPGGEMGNEEPNSDEIASAKLGSSPLHQQQQQLGERPRKKPTSGAMLRKKAMADKWRALQPGASNWSRKMKYLAIGKDRASEYDDIFMLSSINHHVSFLRLRVHPEYLRWLATGALPTSSTDPQWYVLDLKRTRWFDLFDQGDRVDALDGLWGLFGYIMRGE